VEAADRVERGFKLYDSVPERPPIARFGQDVSVLGAAYGTLTLWTLGKPDAGRAMAERALATARSANHPFTLSVALVTGFARVCLLRGELIDALAAVDEAIDITQENKFPYVLHRARMLRGNLRARMGEGPAALAEMPDALAAFRALGAKTTVPVGFAWLGEAQLLVGDHAAAHASLQAGLNVAEETGEASDLAELHRLMGRVARAMHAAREDVERHYRTALDLAEQQQAAGWRLRTALDLAALWTERGEQPPAIKLVSDALTTIEGGSATADVRAARHFLTEVGQSIVSHV
jgi:predicted ATPase